MDISWVLPVLVSVALPVGAKVVDSIMERRKLSAAGQRDDRKTVWERLDIVEAKYDALRTKYDAAIDAVQLAGDERDKVKKERDYFHYHYGRVVNAVQWLILDNEKMCQMLGIVPTHKYRDMTGEFLDGGENPNG